jgi:hypothetical protein
VARDDDREGIVSHGLADRTRGAGTTHFKRKFPVGACVAMWNLRTRAEHFLSKGSVSGEVERNFEYDFFPRQVIVKLAQESLKTGVRVTDLRMGLVKENPRKPQIPPSDRDRTFLRF